MFAKIFCVYQRRKPKLIDVNSKALVGKEM